MIPFHRRLAIGFKAHAVFQPVRYSFDVAALLAGGFGRVYPLLIPLQRLSVALREVQAPIVLV